MLLSENFIFPKMRSTISKILSFCDNCQRNQIYTRGSFAPLQNIIPEKPSDLFSIDFVWPLPQSTGVEKFLLTCVDAYSKFTVGY